MKHLAPGQLLGFAIQFTRALYHLLTCSEGDKVSIEVLGDVAVEYGSGEVTTEEDKSSISANPLTNRSTDLWKTLSNWVSAIKSGDLDVGNTRFILYTNQSGRTAIVNKFHKARDHAEAKLACDEAMQELSDITDTHEIWPYYNAVMNMDQALLIALIQRFEMQVGAGTGADDVKNELEKKFCPKLHIDFVFEKLSGWLHNKVMESIAVGIPAVITWEDFRAEIMPLFERARRRELIDFAREYPPSDTDIKKERLGMPMYLRQLEIIECNDDDLIEAATDFIRAKVNREKWIETETIDETIAGQFEDNLTAYWKNTMQRIPMTHKSYSPEEHGKLVLLDCKSRQELIRDQTPPASTIAGTYHALVNGGQCGWHKDWKTKCS